jgi:hypothetical protein
VMSESSPNAKKRSRIRYILLSFVLDGGVGPALPMLLFQDGACQACCKGPGRAAAVLLATLLMLPDT